MRGEVERFYLFVERSFAGVVEAEEEDGVFFFLVSRGGVGLWRWKGGRGGETDLLCWLRRDRGFWLGGTLRWRVRQGRRGDPVRETACMLPRHG